MPPKKRSPSGAGHSHSHRHEVKVRTTRDAKYVAPSKAPDQAKGDAVEWHEFHDEVSPALTYDPTRSINPPRPRTLAAGYSKEHEVLRIRFRNGSEYEYFDVPPNVWANFRRVKSPGRFVNRVLNNYEYKRMS